MLNMHWITFPVQHHELRGSPQAVMQDSVRYLCVWSLHWPSHLQICWLPYQAGILNWFCTEIVILSSFSRTLISHLYTALWVCHVGIELWGRHIFLVSVKVSTSSSYLMESILNVHFSNHVKKKNLTSSFASNALYQACFHGLHLVCVLGQYKYFRGRCGAHC